MADTVTRTNTLAVGLAYIDPDTEKEKTVYLKLPNPSPSLTESKIKEEVLKLISGDNPILVSPAVDSESGEYVKFDTATAIFTAYTESVTVTSYDIGLE